MQTKNEKLLIVILFWIFGTLTTFSLKLPNSINVREGDHEKKFFHPYMQSFTMFLGQTFFIFFYLYHKKKNPYNLQEGKRQHTPWVFIIPAIADSCTTIFQFAALSFISGSTQMMFKGGVIVTTAFFSKVLIKMKLGIQHFMGCGMTILGIIIVGSSSFIQQSNQGQSTFDQQFVGYVLMLISLIFNGFCYAYEQLLLKNHSINPLEMIGFQGIFGLVILSSVTVILSFIPCSFSQKNCVYSSSNQAFIQIPWVFFQQIFSNVALFIVIICGLISISLFNFNGLRITKLFNALTRSILNQTKTVLIWIVGIIITAIANGNKDYSSESLNVWVNIVKVVGFIVIIAGTLIYNKLICKSCFSKSPIVIQKQNNTSLLQGGEQDSFSSQNINIPKQK